MSLWFNFLFCFLITSCGYTLNHRLKDTFNAGPKGVFVPVFDNVTDEVGAEIVFTNALIRELESHGEKTVPSREGAGLEIKGKILRVFHTVGSTTGGGSPGTRAFDQKKYIDARLYDYATVPDQIGVRVELTLELRDASSNLLKWQKDFAQTRIVSAPLDRVSDRDAPSSLPLITQSLIETTYPEIAREIMREVYDQMVDVY